MTEPTDRDREMAKEVCRTIRRFDPYRPIPHTFISAKLAEAREEGRREESERCAAIAHNYRLRLDGMHANVAEAIEKAIILPEMGLPITEQFQMVIAAARAEERQRCAAIADDQAAKGDEDGDPAVVGACRIAARRIRAGG